MSGDEKPVLSTTVSSEAGGLKKAIIAGIISGIIVLVFVQPFLGFLWKFLLSNIKGFSDEACFQAALDYTDKYPFVMEVRVSAIVIGIVCASVVLAYSATVGHKERPNELRLSLQSLIRRFVRSRVATTAYGVLLILTLTALTAKDYLIMQMKASFHQRLAVLAPKISEQENKEFLAAWASMKNQEDYRKIVANMEAEARRAGVSLPKLLSGATPAE